MIRRREGYEADRAGFAAEWAQAEGALRARILDGRARLAGITRDETVLRDAAELCVALGSDGLRGELTLLRAARAWAAYSGDAAITRAHLRAIAAPALRHRLRRDPLDEAGSGTRVDRVVAEVLGGSEALGAP